MGVTSEIYIFRHSKGQFSDDSPLREYKPLGFSFRNQLYNPHIVDLQSNMNSISCIPLEFGDLLPVKDPGTGNDGFLHGAHVLDRKPEPGLSILSSYQKNHNIFRYFDTTFCFSTKKKNIKTIAGYLINEERNQIKRFLYRFVHCY